MWYQNTLIVWDYYDNIDNPTLPIWGHKCEERVAEVAARGCFRLDSACSSPCLQLLVAFNQCKQFWWWHPFPSAPVLNIVHCAIGCIAWGVSAPLPLIATVVRQDWQIRWNMVRRLKTKERPSHNIHYNTIDTNDKNKNVPVRLLALGSLNCWFLRILFTAVFSCTIYKTMWDQRK